MALYLIDWMMEADQVKLDFIRRYDKEGWSPIENITHLPFIYVKRDIPNFIQESNFDEAFSLTLSKPISEILKIPPLDRFRLLIWIENQYKIINEIETKYLISPPDIKMTAAGVRDLDVLGITNIIDMLANGDITKWKEVEMLPYHMCFDKQLKLSIEKRIEKKLIEQTKNK